MMEGACGGPWTLLSSTVMCTFIACKEGEPEHEANPGTVM